MKNSNIYLLGALVALMLVSTAAASVYLTRESMAPAEEQTSSSTSSHHKSHSDIVWNQRALDEQRAQPVAAAAPTCDDGNIAGKAVGGVGGGVLGSLAGKGHGKTATTIAGTLGGAYLGGEAIPLKNVTCPK